MSRASQVSAARPALVAHSVPAMGHKREKPTLATGNKVSTWNWRTLPVVAYRTGPVCSPPSSLLNSFCGRVRARRGLVWARTQVSQTRMVAGTKGSQAGGEQAGGPADQRAGAAIKFCPDRRARARPLANRATPPKLSLVSAAKIDDDHHHDDHHDHDTILIPMAIAVSAIHSALAVLNRNSPPIVDLWNWAEYLENAARPL